MKMKYTIITSSSDTIIFVAVCKSKEQPAAGKGIMCARGMKKNTLSIAIPIRSNSQTYSGWFFFICLIVAAKCFRILISDVCNISLCCSHDSCLRPQGDC